MTFAPPTLLALRDLWVANGGDFLGIVGDAAHAATGGYHEGRDDLAAAGVLSTDYSVQLPRDRAGLSNAASAFDFGPLHGSLEELQAFSRWLVERCQAKAPGTEDIREVIYSPDGKVVQRWSAVDGQIHPGWPVAGGNGDASHLFHTHRSDYRDSEANDKLAAVAPYFALPPDSSTEDPMPPLVLESLFGFAATIGGPTAARQPTAVYALPSFTAPVLRTVDAAEPYLGLVGWVHGDEDPGNGGSTKWLERVRGDGVREYVPEGDVPSLAAPEKPKPAKATLDSTSAADGQSVVVTIKGA